VTVGVLDHLPPRVKSQPYKVRVSDDTAVMELVFFRADAKYLMEILPPGSRRIVIGPHRVLQGPAADAASRLRGGG
jgi:ATP-dependent DNA helicase RecG